VLELTYVAAVIAFCLSFFLLKIIASCTNIAVSSLNAIEVVFNHLLDDELKQKRIQKTALSVLMQFLLLMLKLALLAASVALPFFAADYFSIVSLEESTQYAMRVDVLLITTLIAIALAYLWKAVRSNAKEEAVAVAESSNETAYSDLERAIHNVSFGSANLTRSLNSIETKLFSEKWQAANADAPVFVTSLARAGTTALLEALAQFPSLASHTYRDMPFIFSPVLWSKLSSRFQKVSEKKERAHGDGLKVNEDSPEAFEEVIWYKFFPQKYSEQKIYLWNTADKGFLNFFSEYLKRIIFLRRPKNINKARYLSKNNANIARIPAIQEMFPKASILIPVREPKEHAVSLFRQHKNFSEKHGGESFTKKYMADIGHFEFGDLHKLIDFPEIDTLLADLNPEHSDYWLAYWLATYRYLNSLEGESIYFISYADLCENSESSLSRICQKLNIEAGEVQIKGAAQGLKTMPSRRGDYHFSETLAQQADELYKELLQKAI
jgi:hypothetical protein